MPLDSAAHGAPTPSANVRDGRVVLHRHAAGRARRVAAQARHGARVRCGGCAARATPVPQRAGAMARRAHSRRAGRAGAWLPALTQEIETLVLRSAYLKRVCLRRWCERATLAAMACEARAHTQRRALRAWHAALEPQRLRRAADACRRAALQRRTLAVWHTRLRDARVERIVACVRRHGTDAGTCSRLSWAASGATACGACRTRHLYDAFRRYRWARAGRRPRSLCRPLHMVGPCLVHGQDGHLREQRAHGGAPRPR